MITIQKVTSNVQSFPRQSPDIYWQDQGDTRLTLMPPVIPNSNYVIMISDWNCLKYCIFVCFCTVIVRCTETFWSPCMCLKIAFSLVTERLLLGVKQRKLEADPSPPSSAKVQIACSCTSTSHTLPLEPNNSQLKFAIKQYCRSTGQIRKTDIVMQAPLPFSAYPLSGVAVEHLNGTDVEF